MKNLIIITLSVLTTIISAQNWTSLKTSDINLSSALENDIDIFTNGYGNHIIVRESSVLKYYKMDVNGDADTPINLEESSVVSPSISGNASNIYVVYRKSSENYIRTKFSSDGGSNWSYISTNPNNSNASSIECIFSNNKLHVTYEVSNIVYYAYYNTQNPVGVLQQQFLQANQVQHHELQPGTQVHRIELCFVYKKHQPKAAGVNGM